MLGLAGCGRDGPWAAGVAAALGCSCEAHAGAAGLLWGNPKLRPRGGGGFQESRGKPKVSSSPAPSGHMAPGAVMKTDSDLRAESPHEALRTEPCPPNSYAKALITNMTVFGNKI